MAVSQHLSRRLSWPTPLSVSQRLSLSVSHSLTCSLFKLLILTLSLSPPPSLSLSFTRDSKLINTCTSLSLFLSMSHIPGSFRNLTLSSQNWNDTQTISRQSTLLKISTSFLLVLTFFWHSRFCDTKLEVPKIWVGEVFCMRGERWPTQEKSYPKALKTPPGFSSSNLPVYQCAPLQRARRGWLLLPEHCESSIILRHVLARQEMPRTFLYMLSRRRVQPHKFWQPCHKGGPKASSCGTHGYQSF